MHWQHRIAPWLCLSINAMAHECHAPDRTGKVNDEARSLGQTWRKKSVVPRILWKLWCFDTSICAAFGPISYRLPQFSVSRMAPACGISCFDGTSCSLWSNGSLEYENEFTCAWHGIRVCGFLDCSSIKEFDRKTLDVEASWSFIIEKLHWMG